MSGKILNVQYRDEPKLEEMIFLKKENRSKDGITIYWMNFYNQS